jgi:hypothetical protein
MEIDGIVGDLNKGMSPLEEDSDNTHLLPTADESPQQPSESGEPDDTLQSLAEYYDSEAKGEVSPSPGGFLGLPLEIRTKVLQQVASFRDRGDARQGLQNLRAVNRQLKHEIQEVPTVNQSYQHLQRHPRIDSRVEAGVRDIDAGMSAPKAVEAHELIHQNDIDKVLVRAAIRDIDAGASAPKAILDNGLTNRKDIDDMKCRAALTEYLGGKSLPDAVRDQEMDNQEHISELENLFG